VSQPPELEELRRRARESPWREDALEGEAEIALESPAKARVADEVAERRIDPAEAQQGQTTVDHLGLGASDGGGHV
jgi:hypothetical protein